MKKFILNCAGFLLLLGLTNLVFFVVLKRIYFDEYKPVEFGFKSYIVADSHGVILKDGTREYGAYNFSMASDSYEDMYRKILFLIAKTDVKTIYITADEHMFSPYRETRNNMDRSIVFALPSEFQNIFMYGFYRYVDYYCIWTQPKARLILKEYITAAINRRISRGGRKDVSLTWEGLSVEERMDDALERIEEQFPEEAPSDKLKAALNDIFEVCRQHHIELIGIKFPLSAEYLAVLRGKTYGVQDEFEQWSIPVLDYHSLFISRPDYFANSDHLNEKGGEALSRILFKN